MYKQIMYLATSNSTSGGFISISIIKIQDLKIDNLRVRKKENKQLSFSRMILLNSYHMSHARAVCQIEL